MKLTIRLKMLTFTMGIILLVGGAISLFGISLSAKNILTSFIDQSIKITSLISKDISKNLYSLDIKNLNYKVEQLKVNPDIGHVYIMDQTGMLLADGTEGSAFSNHKFSDPFSKDILKAKHWITASDSKILRVGGPVLVAQTKLLGFIQIEFSLEKINQFVAETSKKVITITIVSLSIGMILAILFSLSITKPITNLVSASELIGSGNYNTVIKADRNDELGMLSKTFNQMNLNLQANTVSRIYVENIIQSLSDMLLVLDKKGIIKTVNSSAINLLGHQQQELLGLSIEEILAPDQDDPSRDSDKSDIEENKPLFHDYKKLNQSIQAGKVKEITGHFLTKQKEKIPVIISGSVLKQKGEINAIILSAKDARDSRLLEKLKSTQQQLIQSAKLASLGEMSAGLAHELNNPLQFIMGFNQSLRTLFKHQKDVSYNDVKDYFHEINSACQRMREIIQHFRLFSRQKDLSFSNINRNSSHPMREFDLEVPA
ncbi:MAG: HAMP domain-containing protein [Bacteriovoracaceae bacterium]|nr:HAMP domain-containing protein [Bacteriovoracaceae bacterium]